MSACKSTKIQPLSSTHSLPPVLIPLFSSLRVSPSLGLPCGSSCWVYARSWAASLLICAINMVPRDGPGRRDHVFYGPSGTRQRCRRKCAHSAQDLLRASEVGGETGRFRFWMIRGMHGGDTDTDTRAHTHHAHAKYMRVICGKTPLQRYARPQKRERKRERSLFRRCDWSVVVQWCSFAALEMIHAACSS